MEILELYAGEDGETHFRRTQLALERRDFAPPSAPMKVSAGFPLTTGIFIIAPPGWDDSYHATPRRQLCVVISGAATVTATDGETIEFGPGGLLLLNDETSKGHLTRVQGKSDFCCVLMGMENSTG